MADAYVVDTQVAVYVLAAIGILVAIGIGVWQHLRERGKAPAPADADKSDPQYRPCRYCGEPATRPKSKTARGVTWLDALRVRFGAAPRYGAAIDDHADDEICETHGRAWDARLTSKLVSVVQAERTTTEVRIADRIAAYESEILDAEMIASLTDAQRAALVDRQTKNTGDSK